MENKTQNQFEKYKIKLAYFNYWKLQNNPDYIEFYKIIKNKKKDENKIIFIDNEKKLDSSEIFRKLIGNDNKVYFVLEEGKLLSAFRYAEEKFKLGFFSIINPFKKIDWANFPNLINFDNEIITFFNWSEIYRPVWLSSFKYSNPTEKDFQNHFLNPIVKFDIDLRYDKSEILSSLSDQIDIERRNRKIYSFERHRLDKFHLYAQVWELRKGYPKKTFKEIAFELKQKHFTIISRYKKARELLFGNEINKPKTELRSSCKNCPEWQNCKIPCPEIEMELANLEVKQSHKLGRVIENGKRKKISTYEIALERKSYLNWITKNN